MKKQISYQELVDLHYKLQDVINTQNWEVVNENGDVMDVHPSVIIEHLDFDFKDSMLTFEEIEEMISCGIISYDDTVNWAVDGKNTGLDYFTNPAPKGATHVIYYGK